MTDNASSSGDSHAPDITAAQAEAQRSDVTALTSKTSVIGELMPRDLAGTVRGLAATNSRSLGGETAAAMIHVAAQMLTDERDQLRADLARERARAEALSTALTSKTTECAVAQNNAARLKDAFTLRMALSTFGAALLATVQPAYGYAPWLGVLIVAIAVSLIGFGIWSRK